MVADSIVIKITPTSRLTDLSSRDVTIRFWSPGSESERRISQTRRFSFPSKKGRTDVDDSPAPINPVLKARMGADVRIIPFSSLIFFLAAFLLSTTGVLYLALKPPAQTGSSFTAGEVYQNNPPLQAAIIPMEKNIEILPVVSSAEVPSMSDDSPVVPTKKPRAKKIPVHEPPALEPKDEDGKVKLDDNPY